MARIVALLLSALTLACASAKLATRDVIAVAKAPTAKRVAITAAATGAALIFDEEIARLARRNTSPALDRITEIAEPFGGGASDRVIAGFLLYGVANDDARARAVAFDAVVSSVIASKAITPAMKELTSRTRPNGDGHSFPSNHATQAFAVATVVASHYEQSWVRWLAYGLASGVGLARVYHDAHYTSDVIAGAAIGALVGRTVAITNRNERMNWTVRPMRKGAVVSLTW